MRPSDRNELNCAPLAGLRILLAEDDFLIALDMEATLQALGCVVVGPARAVREIADFAGSTHLDGALLDVRLGDDTIDGVLPTLVDRGVRVILSSGYDEKALAAKYQGLAVLAKPYTGEALRAACERVFLGAR